VPAVNIQMIEAKINRSHADELMIFFTTPPLARSRPARARWLHSASWPGAAPGPSDIQPTLLA
jgi:hypothetical protein